MTTPTTDPRPRRAALLLLAVWLAGAVVATSVGLLAVRLVAEQVGDPAAPPLTAAAAASPGPSRPASPAPSPRPSVSPAPTSSPAGTTAAVATFRSDGGTVGLECAGGAARLLYATPADGYALDERSVAGSEAEVRFEGRGTRVRMELGCAGGRPALLDVRTDARD